MTSRFTLVVATGLIWAGCSSPAEDAPDAPTTPPPLATNPGAFGQGGSTGAPVTPAPTPTAQGGTTGQTGAVPAGTGGTAVAVAGAGGAPAAAGGAPATAIPTGMGTLIMHDPMGWVAGATNAAGIQGSFYPFGDYTNTPAGDTMVTVGALAAAPTSVCISGTASQVQTPAGALMPDYGRYYGGGIGLNLADPGAMMPLGGWNRGTVTGFSFTVTGTAIPAGEQLRFKVTTLEGTTVNENGYCTTASAGANTFRFGELVNECWTGGTGTPALGAATPIVALQWQVATVATAETPFNFCIENLTTLTTP